ncbi:unnamed protein product [Prorocentrum cordatum]|uniref:RRM domain-containing protein n=1 Tax=Prorocentrum cordatum TaxID=2364126 RepID=A0ABN9V194_9DINO|nr:unnamed protein product [Polarella glacialis]
MDAFTRRGSFQCVHSDDLFETYLNPHPLDQLSGDMCTSLPSMGSLPTTRPVTTQTLPLWQEDHLILQSSVSESWKTLDEFDLPRERRRAEDTSSHPSERAQDSAWLGPGGAPSATYAQLSSQPGGVPLLHGQPLPRRQEGHPTLQPSGREPWKAAGELDRPRAGPAPAARAAAGRGAAGEAREVRRSIREQTALLEELELPQGERVDSVPAAAGEAAPAAPGVPGATTLMISNIPMAMSQSDLLDLIDKTGFASRYDYAYMPATFETGTTKGIAFVNFATSSDAREFSILWHKSRLTGVDGAGTKGSVIEVSASATQGYSENARMWKASRLRRIKNPRFHPFIALRPADH